MNSIHIHTMVNSDTLHLPELQPFIGKSVEIFVLETPTTSAAIESLETFLGGRANRPQMEAAELQALRSDDRFARFWPFLDSLSPDALDVDAIVKWRAESPT